MSKPSPIARLKAFCRRLHVNVDGGVAAAIAVTTPLVIGISGLGVETGLWYLDKRQAQSAADAAAVAGALERVRGKGAGVVTAAAQAAGKNSFSNAGNTSIQVFNPPSSGAYAGNGAAVEVRANRGHKPLFAALFLNNDVDVAARAVALIKTTGEACVLALDPASSSAVGNKGNPTINMSGCTVAANSASATAMQMSGSSILVAFSLWLVGNYSSSGSAQMTLTQQPMTDAWALPDPYASETLTPPSGCKATNLKVNSGTVTLTPGTYCGGIDIGSQAKVTFQPGTYVINRGDFNVNAGAVVNCNCSAAGSGVTFELTSSGSASQIGTVTINGGATVNLTAPSDPSYAHPGLLFYQDPRAPTNQIAKFNGGSSMALNGSLYFPKQEIEYAGGNSPTAPTCTQIIGLRVTFTGNSKVDNSGCVALGVKPVTISGIQLVE